MLLQSKSKLYFNTLLHNIKKTTNFFEKKLDKKLYLLQTEQNKFLTTGAPLSFNYNRHSTSIHSSKTKFCTKVLCLLSFKKVSEKRLSKIFTLCKRNKMKILMDGVPSSFICNSCSSTKHSH